jgi:hypothetical protein
MSHRTLYWLVGGLVVVLLVVMLATFDYDRSNKDAEAKAEQLISDFHAAGLRTPADAKQVARVLGTDGGIVCRTAGSDLANGLIKLNLSVGGAFYIRPIRADRRVAQGALLIAKTYCPDKLDDIATFIRDQHFTDVIRR